MLNTGLPTFVSSSCGTFSHIDLALATRTIANLATWDVHTDTLGSDHFPCRIYIGLQHPATLDNVPPTWILRRANWELFQNSLDDFLNANPLPTDVTIDDAQDHFVRALTHAASTSIPSRKPGPPRRRLVPWWTKDCSVAVKAKRAAFRHLRCSLTPANLATYRRLSAVAKQTLRQAQRTSWRQFCENLSFQTPLSLIWRRLKSVDFNRPTCSAVLPELPMDFKFSALQQTFTSDIPQQILSSHRLDEITQQVNNIISSTCSCTSALCLPYTKHELNSAIRKLRATASGADNLPPELLHHLTDTACSTLLTLFNLSWKCSTVPSSWLRSLTILIPKPSRPTSSPSSYRPISLTSALCRLMELLVQRRLQWYFAITNQLAPQNGFIPGRSVLHGQLLLEHDVRTGFDHHSDTLACFLDMEKAFDSVWHHGLLIKCHRLGLPTCAIRWIHSLLTNRTSQIKINNSISDSFEVHNGTPQGSVLSPLLFNIMMHDIPETLPPSVRITIFADDLCIWYTGKNIPIIANHLQDALEALEDWASSWGFWFSPSKSTVLHFTKSRQLQPTPSLWLDGQLIPRVNEHRFLGIVFDKNLNWKSHLSHLRNICEKKNQLLRYICGHSWGATRSTLIRIYTTLIRPHLEFGAPLILRASHNILHALEIIQASCLRICTGLPNSTPHLALQVETGVEPIEHRLLRLTISQLLRTITLAPHSPLAKLISTYLDASRLTWKFTPPAVAHVADLLCPILPTLPSLPSPLSIPTWLLHPPLLVFPPLPLRSITDASRLRASFFDSISPEYDQHLHIYTDGSFDPDSGTTTSSFYIPDLNCSTSTSLPLHTGIYLAELFAIYAALQHLTNTTPRDVIIFSDSKSALASLADSQSKQMTTLHTDILVTYHSLKLTGFTIVLHWVPAHCGVSGNEEADRLAAHPNSVTAYNFPIPHWNISCHLLRPLLKSWQQS